MELTKGVVKISSPDAVGIPMEICNKCGSNSFNTSAKCSKCGNDVSDIVQIIET